MSGGYTYCGHLIRDAEGCPECRAAVERMRSMLRDIPLGHRHGPCRACDKATADLAALRAAVEGAEARAVEAEKWREEVAEGLGYINRPEGQGGYEVADPQTIIAAFRAMRRERGAAVELVERLERQRRQIVASEAALAGDMDDAICRAIDAESDLAALRAKVEELAGVLKSGRADNAIADNDSARAWLREVRSLLPGGDDAKETTDA